MSVFFFQILIRVYCQFCSPYGLFGHFHTFYNIKHTFTSIYKKNIHFIIYKCFMHYI